MLWESLIMLGRLPSGSIGQASKLEMQVAVDSVGEGKRQERCKISWRYAEGSPTDFTKTLTRYASSRRLQAICC